MVLVRSYSHTQNESVSLFEERHDGTQQAERRLRVPSGVFFARHEPFVEAYLIAAVHVHRADARTHELSPHEATASCARRIDLTPRQLRTSCRDHVLSQMHVWYQLLL